MRKKQNSMVMLIISIIVSLVAFWLLKIFSHPAKTDLIIEGFLFAFAGTIGFLGFFRKTGNETKPFIRFELFYGLTYSLVAVACILGIIFLFQHANVYKIGLSTVEGSPLLQIMSGVKSLSFVFMFLAWFFFYRNLNINVSKGKKVAAFFTGFGGYLGISLIILAITGDTTIISLGIIVGAAIGLFAMIALHPATRFLSIIFLLFSLIHLWEFYLMGVGANLVTGINNPVYWVFILLYALEVNRWITRKQYTV